MPAPALLDGVDCVVLDCDGVLWMGDRVIDGAPQVWLLLLLLLLLLPKVALRLAAAAAAAAATLDDSKRTRSHEQNRPPQAVAAMRAAGKRLLFLTNNSSKSRAQYAAKLEALGFGGAADEVVASSYLAAA